MEPSRLAGDDASPVGDHLGPFEPQRYFDGHRVRTQASADELAKFYLAPLGVQRSACWVTDIVKVFLFKEGHRDKYARLGATPPARYERERFEELASRSLPWVERELELACPRLVITLGAEIAGIVRSVASPTRRNALLGPGISPVRFGASEFPTVHLAHPGIVMRKGDGSKNPWPKLHEQEHIPALKAAMRSL